MLDAVAAPDGFDARFSATAREYRYRIDERDPPDPFVARYAWSRLGRLAVAPMRAAARALVGERDFASFCRHPGADRSTVRNLTTLTVARRGELLEIRAVANAFLHQMVRSLVGTLVVVGEGRLDPGAMSGVLAARVARPRAHRHRPWASPWSGSTTGGAEEPDRFDAGAFPQVAWAVGLPGRHLSR